MGTPGSDNIPSVTDGAWDPVTGKSYIIGNGYEGPCELWEADTTTGTFTYLFDIVFSVEEPTYDCDAFDIAPDGTAWVTLFDGEILTKLNLADGTTSDGVPISDTAGVSWIAVQPSTGVVYLGDWSDDLYTIDPATGATTLVAAWPNNDGPGWYDAAFDSNGRLWITGWPEGDTFLYSADVADFANTFVVQGPIQIEGSSADTGTDSLWITRGGPDPVVEPALAATGLETAGALGAGLALLVLGAGAFAVARTRRA